jgi:hypothetical protein
VKNDSERQKIEDTDKKFEDIKRLFSRNEFRIEKYVINKPSQEFINNNELKTEVRAHTNKPGYSNYKPKRSISNLEKIKINNLNDVIALRLDNENYGFIHNIELDKIFYANRTTLKSIQQIINEPLFIINREVPQLLKELLIK